MPKGQALSPGVSSAIGRLWWVIVLAAIIGGAVSFAAADRSTTERIYGVVNIRPVATLANDRVDLVEDLDAALTLPSVLSGPAEDADMSVDESPSGPDRGARGRDQLRPGECRRARRRRGGGRGRPPRRRGVGGEFMSGDDPAAIADDTLAQQLEFVDQRIDALDNAVAAAEFGSAQHTRARRRAQVGPGAADRRPAAGHARGAGA